MNLTYECINKSCCEREKAQECLKLSIESVMDERNIATLYCPKCGKELKRVE